MCIFAADVDGDKLYQNQRILSQAVSMQLLCLYDFVANTSLVKANQLKFFIQS